MMDQQPRRPDLSILGNSIKALAPGQWQANMFFAGAPDEYLKAKTGGFPATFRRDYTTHPIFVLTSHPAGNLVCPCSTKGSPGKYRYLRQGCQLEMRAHSLDRNSYLIEQYIFTLPLDDRVNRQLIFQGLVPSSCLEDRRHGK